MAEDPHECCKKGTPHSGTTTGTSLSLSFSSFVLHKYTPDYNRNIYVLGSEVKLEGLDVYISEPLTPSDKAVLFLHDGFGWKLTNSRLLADHYAKVSLPLSFSLFIVAFLFILSCLFSFSFFFLLLFNYF